MTDPICRELQSDLHAVTLGEGIACDYHERPKELAIDESVLAECIRVVDHPQLPELPEGWIVDAARCSTHAVSEIVEPTRGFEEALVQLPVTESNNVVSVDVPEIEAIRVLAFEPATEGLHPMSLDQQLMASAAPGDMGLSRWTRVIGMVDADPPAELREHIKHLIDKSTEIPPTFE